MKIATAVINLIILGGIGFGMFFFLLLTLNGFSERDANPAMIFYTLWVIVFSLALSVGSYFLTGFMIKKSMNAIFAMLIAIVVTGGIGLVIDFGGLIISSIIASEVRNSYKK